jgi:energy-coupling factor transporter ATP-binding protein EcfA2
LTPLEDLLQQCTVKITVPGGWGTGFFVAPGLILTCAHVVRKAADLPVTVFYPARQQPLAAIVKAKADDGKTLDLALVELFEPLPDHACVLLDEEPVEIGQALYSYGYLESYTHAAPVRPVNEGWTGDTPPLLKLQGAQIEKGISGAALLNLKTGKVCGMVKETRAAGFDLGGGAIPTRVILEQFPELRSLQREFHGGDRRWRDRVASAAATSQTASQTSSQFNSGGTNYQTQTGNNNINYIGETHIYTYPASPPEACIAADEIQRYLQAVAVHYEKWWEVYTLMDAESRAQKKQKTVPLFDFGLILKPLALKDEIEQDDVPDAQVEIERFPVIEGLQKYLFQEHVLLVGRSGSGKSTTLARLMFELAKDGQIPILVELRRYESSILELIRSSCKHLGLNLETTQIEMLLDDQKLILLVDGVNELPLKFEKNLSNFRHNYPKVPMVFTTRDADLYGGLSIERKLEIQPLTESQMRAFAQKYLSKQADRMLRTLKNRLQEFGTTPLFLWVLCSLFDETKDIPQNLGEMFRLFTNSYEKKINRDIVPEVDRRLWRNLLKQLAAKMIQNDKSPAISQTEACEVFADNLKALEASDPLVSNKALDDLLNHHLIQRNGDLIEFRHQLIQEYYAAEWLLDEIGTLDGKTLDCEYLNCLKWTEPLALMLSLMEDKDEAKALWVVERALAVDLMLGARLAGEVRSKKLQRSIARNTIKTIRHLINYPDSKKSPDVGFEIYLLSLTKSKIILDEIIPKKKNRYNNKKSKIVLASVMDKFGEPAIYALRDLENDDDPKVRGLYARSLGNIPSEESIKRLLALLQDANFQVRAKAMLSLSDLLVKMKFKNHDCLTKFYSELDSILTIKDPDIYKLGIIAFAKLTIGLSQDHPG